MGLKNLQKVKVLEEYKRIQETGHPPSILDLPDWTIEKFRLKNFRAKQLFRQTSETRQR